MQHTSPHKLVHVSALDHFLERRERWTQFARKRLQRSNMRRIRRDKRDNKRQIVDVDENDVVEERRHGLHGTKFELADLV